VARGARLDAGRQRVEDAHHVVESHGVSLGDFHGFELRHFCAFGHAVFAVVGEVAHVGDVAHIAHAVAEVQQIPINGVKTAKGAAIAEVNVVVNGRPADVHSDVAFVNGPKNLFFARQGVV
jgi:hypothetical protein